MLQAENGRVPGTRIPHRAGKLEDQLLILLDIDKILDKEEVAEFDAVGSGA